MEIHLNDTLLDLCLFGRGGKFLKGTVRLNRRSCLHDNEIFFDSSSRRQ